MLPKTALNSKHHITTQIFDVFDTSESYIVKTKKGVRNPALFVSVERTRIWNGKSRKHSHMNVPCIGIAKSVAMRNHLHASWRLRARAQVAKKYHAQVASPLLQNGTQTKYPKTRSKAMHLELVDQSGSVGSANSTNINRFMRLCFASTNQIKSYHSYHR